MFFFVAGGVFLGVFAAVAALFVVVIPIGGMVKGRKGLLSYMAIQSTGDAAGFGGMPADAYMLPIQSAEPAPNATAGGRNGKEAMESALWNMLGLYWRPPEAAYELIQSLLTQSLLLNILFGGAVASFDVPSCFPSFLEALFFAAAVVGVVS